MQSKTQWFEQGLGARIDALAIALESLRRNETYDTTVIRNLAHSLMGPAQMYGYHSISSAAATVNTAANDTLEESVHLLIDILRKEAAKTSQTLTVILIIGGEKQFNSQLTEEIEAPSRKILCVDSALEAQDIIRQGEVMFIVLNLLLPDLDGRSFLLTLRENPETVSIPTLILAPTLTEEVRDEAQIIDADVLIENPPNTRTVSDRINSRLRRSHETVRVARRDPVTSLLNRAAFREVFTQMTEKAMIAGEPLALAIVSLDSPRSTLDSQGPDVKNEILRRIASIMSNSFRSTDVIARWAGCDFAVMLPGEDQLGGSAALKKIIRQVADEEFVIAPGKRISLTMSSGVTTVDAATSLDDAMSNAHGYLFQASSDGGNQVVFSRTPSVSMAEKILLIVHDGLTSQVMKHLLDRDGFTVTRLSQVQTPLPKELKEGKFHLIVIDEGIQPKGGFEILQEFRALPQNSRTPMVMLISHNSEESMARALEVGASDYMMRPFSPFTFLRRMRRLLKKGFRELDTRQSGEICRVLIVDRDKKSLLMAASALYERGGFVPLLAHRSGDAESRLGEVGADAVLVDADMDQAALDGLLKTISESTTPKPKTILASEEIQSESIKNLAERIGAGLIAKPFDALSLGIQVEKELHLSPSSVRPPDSARQLNLEIQRIMKQHA